MFLPSLHSLFRYFRLAMCGAFETGKTEIDENAGADDCFVFITSEGEFLGGRSEGEGGATDSYFSCASRIPSTRNRLCLNTFATSRIEKRFPAHLRVTRLQCLS